MAALSITAANVRLISNTRTETVTAGEAITQGQPVFLSDSKYYLTDADDTDEDLLHGIALTPADADGDKFIVVTTAGAILDIGATTAKGLYVPGATAGSWHPIADATTNWAVIPGLLATDTSGTVEFCKFNATTPAIL